MIFNGYVVDIENEVDAVGFDMDESDYYSTDAALVSQDRTRLEWTEGDEFWAITIDQLFENEEVEFGTGRVDRIYTSWEERRRTQRHDIGEVTAIVIADDDENEYHLLDECWLDVKWTIGPESGRLLFELETQRDQ